MGQGSTVRTREVTGVISKLYGADGGKYADDDSPPFLEDLGFGRPHIGVDDERS